MPQHPDDDHRLLPEFADKLISRTTWDNFHLQFYKGAYRLTEENRFDIIPPVGLASSGDNPDRGGGRQGEPAEERRFTRPAFNDEQVKAIQRRQGSIVHRFGLQVPDTLWAGEFAVNWRLIIGLGHPSVYENGMTLHFTYGLPYLPASGIKGLVRNAIIYEAFAGKEWEAEKNLVFQALFGKEPTTTTAGSRGQLIFFDAFTKKVAPSVEPDMMNNHYQSYYEGRTPPGDWIDPNPISFLSVTKGRFVLRLGFPERRRQAFLSKQLAKDHWNSMVHGLALEEQDQILADQNLLTLASAWLVHALNWQGIGAKTAVGYGRLEKK